MNVMKVKHPLGIIYTIYPLKLVNAGQTFVNEVGVGWVSFSALGSGFGFLDFARVGFRVKEIWFGSSSCQIFFHFSVNLGCIWQQISKISQKNLFRVTRVL